MRRSDYEVLQLQTNNMALVWKESRGIAPDSVEGTGADGVVLTIDLQQKAGILHRVFKHISRPVVVVDLHVEIAECGPLLNRLKPQVFRRCRHPLALCLALAKKLKEVPGFAERAAEVVREYFGFHHFVVPPLKPAKRNLDKKRRFDLRTQIKAQWERRNMICPPRNARLCWLTAYEAPYGR